MKVLVFSQNKVLQRFAQQIIDDKVVDRVQQRFEEQDLEAPPRLSRAIWRKSGGAVLPRGQVARALTWKPGHYFYELPCTWQTLAPDTSVGGFGRISHIFLREGEL